MNRSSKVFQDGGRKKSELPAQVLGVLLVALALLMAVSLLSHSPEDPPNSSRPPELAQNLAGWFGAQLSYYLLFLAGYGAYGFTVLVFLWGWNRFRRSPVLPLACRTLTVLCALVLYCGATGVPSRGRTYTAFRMGGWLGVTISSTILVPYLGRVGSYIFLSTALLVLLMVATDIPFNRIPDLAGAVFRKAWGLASSLWTGALLGVRKGKDRWAAALDERRAAAEAAREAKEYEEEGVEEVFETDALFAEPAGEVEEAVEDGALAQAEQEALVRAALPGPEIVAPSAPPEPARARTKPRGRPKSAGSGAAYTLPDLDLLEAAPDTDTGPDRKFLLEGAQTLERSLDSFGIQGKVVQVNPGPVITCYEVEPPPGVKVNRIVNLSDDLALVMKARTIRVQAPIPGKAAVGVEVPNPRPTVVYLREILDSRAFRDSPAPLMLALGKTASGEPFCADLAKMPHLLIAGATGSGKSVCINAIISSILFRNSPRQTRFLMVDPKMLELSVYDAIPHLLAPVVTDPKKASEALRWAVGEMENRYRTLARYGVRNIVDFNRKLDRLRKEAKSEEDRQEVPEPLAYLVVVVDELADLMMTAPADIEDSLARLAQMARAVGIHLILATQRPTVNVITGTIKANFPSRVAFRVASKVDSRTILDTNGAEKLLGQGDMLFMPSGRPDLIRLHGAWISTEETERLVQWVGGQDVEMEGIDLGVEDGDVAIANQGRDERFDEAMRLVVAHQQGSASLLQRRMKVGYARAARLIDELEAAGIVGPSDGGGKSRDVLVSEEYLAHLDGEREMAE